MSDDDTARLERIERKLDIQSSRLVWVCEQVAAAITGIKAVPGISAMMRRAK